MKASRFSEEQIIHPLQQAERGEQTIGVLCRDTGSASRPSTAGATSLAV
jgi:hypothetical protein